MTLFARFLKQRNGKCWVAFVRGLGCSWALADVVVMGCCGAEVHQGKFPSISHFKFYLLFLFSVLIFLFEFKVEFYFILQVLKYFNIRTIWFCYLLYCFVYNQPFHTWLILCSCEMHFKLKMDMVLNVYLYSFLFRNQSVWMVENYNMCLVNTLLGLTSTS
jgi:hypothetical protein